MELYMCHLPGPVLLHKTVTYTEGLNKLFLL